MPVYLQYIGFSVFFIGLLEGAAEAMAGFSKGYFGKLSDDVGKRTPIVSIGYGLSAIAKPLLALSTLIPWVFGARLLDRLGKGVRTAARDAILSDESQPEFRARVFGFHRAMDTLGAALGPVCALLFLFWYPAHYKSLFLLAFIPALFGVVISLLVKEKKKTKPLTVSQPYRFFAFLSYWNKSSTQYKKLIIGLLAFALLNSADALLLLYMKFHGLSDVQVIGVYIFYNIVYAATSYPFGVLADKLGKKQVFIFGLLLFALVYCGITMVSGLLMYGGLFLLYGMYAAATEGVAKAWIANISPKNETATALGYFAGMSSICSMISSALAGWLWYAYNPNVPFLFAGIGRLIVIGYLLFINRTVEFNNK